MALKKCKDCGHEVSTDAKTCPNCGANLEEEKKLAAGCIAAIIIVILLPVLIVGGLFLYSILTPPDQTTQRITLNAQVIFTGTQFEITNGDSFDWKNIRIELNAGTLSGGYELTHPIMSPGQSYTVGAMQFSKGDGARFNPLTMKPRRLFIACDTPKGRGTWGGDWK